MPDERDVIGPDYETRYNNAEAKLKEVTSLVDQVKAHNEKLVAEVAELKKANAHAAGMLNAMRFILR